MQFTLDQEINKLLQTTLVAYEELRNQGRFSLASAVLGMGSAVSHNLIQQGKIKNHKVYCSKCGKQLRNGFDIEFMKSNDCCISCEGGN
jgi:hypothetical protein